MTWKWLLMGMWLISACAPSLKHYDRVDQNLLSRQYEEADRIVDKNLKGYGDRNILLYYLDRAMLLHLAGRYQESNRFFEKAKTTVERLYTESLLEHAGALISNDNLLPYDGEDFEKVLIHLFSSLNYAAMSKWDDALVEARQVDARLNQLNDRYEKKNIYKKDAFARYLSGVLYEKQGELNDALISYQKAYEAFRDYQREYGTPFPTRLGYDLLKMSAALHLDEEFEDYSKQFPQAAAAFSNKTEINQGELVVVTYTGRSPIKVDEFIQAPVPDGEGGTYLLRIAFPKFVPRSSEVAKVTIMLKMGELKINASLDLLEDITAIAKKNLEDRIGRISVKAIARASAKYMATLKARRSLASKKGQNCLHLPEKEYNACRRAEAQDNLLGQLIGLLGNVYTVATEQADKRSWQTLPGRIYLGRIRLPEGTWQAEIRFLGMQGEIIEMQHFPGLRVKKEDKHFLLAHTAR